MAERVREHALLRSMHAAVQLHRACNQQQQPADPAAPASAEASAESSSLDEDCPRCTALTSATAAAAVPDASEWSQLYRDALSISPPFATLSPNLSQLAFCVQPQQRSTNAQSIEAAAGAAVAAASDSSSTAAPPTLLAPDIAAAAPSISELLTPAGFLRWDAFVPLAAAASSSASAASPSSAASSFSPASSNAESIYALSSSRLVSACASLHDWLRRLDPAQFARRYEAVQSASQHGSTLLQLFQMYRSACNEEEAGATVDAASSSSSPMSSLSPVAATCAGAQIERQRHSVGLVLMIVSSHTERVLGDIFHARRASPSVPVPRMLRDLLASAEVASALPPPALHLIQSLIGSPRAFNLRNILWHGFLPLVDSQTNQALQSFTAATILLHLSILRECTEHIWPPPVLSMAVNPAQTNKEDFTVPPPAIKAAPRRPLKHKFPGDAALKAHLSSALFAPTDSAVSSTASAASNAVASVASFSSAAAVPAAAAPEFPSAFESWPIPPLLVWCSDAAAFAALSSSLRQLLSSSYFLAHHRLHDLMHAWSLLPRHPYLALASLMPVVESVVRQWFVYANAECSADGGGECMQNDRIEAGLLLAQSERLFTTMDVVLGARIDPLDSAGDADAAEGEAGASPSPPPQPQVKCDRASAFAFPLVASACSFPSAPSPQHNALYRASVPDLPSLPGAGLMLALSELLISRVGPRLRDRVAHGEITWSDAEGTAHSNKTLEPWLVLYAFNIVVAMAVQFPLCAPASAATTAASLSSLTLLPPSLQLPAAFSTPLALRARSWLSNYIPVGHARSITCQRIIEATRGIELMENHRLAWELRVAQDSVDSSDCADLPTNADEGLSLRAPVHAWYSLVFTHPTDSLQRRLRLLESECVAHAGAGLEAMTLWANRLAVQAGMLMQSMRLREPTMPLWTSMPSWLFGSDEVNAEHASVQHWWSLWRDPFWSRSHQRFHHTSGAAGGGDAASDAAVCSLSCIVHCHDQCMSHAPILCLERMFDTVPALLTAFDSGYTALQDVAAGPAAPSAKRKLAEHVQEALPAVIACCATTMAALALLWEHLHAKAHDPQLTVASSEATSPSIAAAASSCSTSPAASSDLLLRRDRSIARLLKKSSGALDRVRLLYAANRWLPAMDEWAIVMQAIHEWVEVGWA